MLRLHESLQMALKCLTEKYWKRSEYNYKTANNLFLFSIAGPSLRKMNQTKTSGMLKDSWKTWTGTSPCCMGALVIELDGSSPEIVVISFGSFRMFLKPERLKRLEVMWSCSAFREVASSGRAVQHWEERTNSKGTSAIISWFEQCLGSDWDRTDWKSSAWRIHISPGSPSSMQSCHTSAAWKTCPQKAPAALSRDQKTSSSSLRVSTLGRPH